jgi:hypothetical protein
MTKETYLKELKKRLSLINSEEVEKVTVAYNDYLKRQSGEGYTDEEALEQLGDVNQLARTILESYKISEKYIKWFVGKERMVDDLNEFTSKVADSSIEVLTKIEKSAKKAVKKTIQFGGNRVHDVKSIFTKSEKKKDDVEE